MDTICQGLVKRMEVDYSSSVLILFGAGGQEIKIAYLFELCVFSASGLVIFLRIFFVTASYSLYFKTI